jgi:hypothetical protein
MTTLGTFRDDFYNSMAVLAQNQYVTNAVVGSQTIPAAQMAGAQECYLSVSPTGASTYTTDTAANIIARLQNAVQVALNAAGQQGAGTQGSPAPGVPNLFNTSYYFEIINTNGTGTITLAAGAGVTLGTSSNALIVSSTRGWLVTVTGPATVTIQTVGSGAL